MKTPISVLCVTIFTAASVDTLCWMRMCALVRRSREKLLEAARRLEQEDRRRFTHALSHPSERALVLKADFEIWATTPLYPSWEEMKRTVTSLPSGSNHDMSEECIEFMRDYLSSTLQLRELFNKRRPLFKNSVFSPSLAMFMCAVTCAFTSLITN